MRCLRSFEDAAFLIEPLHRFTSSINRHRFGLFTYDNVMSIVGSNRTVVCKTATSGSVTMQLSCGRLENLAGTTFPVCRLISIV